MGVVTRVKRCGGKEDGWQRAGLAWLHGVSKTRQEEEQQITLHDKQLTSTEPTGLERTVAAGANPCRSLPAPPAPALPLKPCKNKWEDARVRDVQAGRGVAGGTEAHTTII